MLSARQHAWGQHFEQSQVIVVICGSQIRTIERLLGRQSPSYGRLAGQWPLRPLPFGALRAFLLSWCRADRGVRDRRPANLSALARLRPHAGRQRSPHLARAGHNGALWSGLGNLEATIQYSRACEKGLDS